MEMLGLREQAIRRAIISHEGKHKLLFMPCHSFLQNTPSFAVIKNNLLLVGSSQRGAGQNKA